MALPTAVNDQITDAVIQPAPRHSGDAPAPGGHHARHADLPPDCDPAELEALIRHLKSE
ncbi:hypothetical protein [Chromobacterium phragmitis]|uniref:Uncharacterized protein n=1 Tax=Chromobacterium phragmitis TaxID=2202141 RepID=A0ABV0IZW2_9NEIS|nr:hypothetical protein [Chromobacterium phragmitis]